MTEEDIFGSLFTPVELHTVEIATFDQDPRFVSTIINPVVRADVSLYVTLTTFQIDSLEEHGTTWYTTEATNFVKPKIGDRIKCGSYHDFDRVGSAIDCVVFEVFEGDGLISVGLRLSE